MKLVTFLYQQTERIGIWLDSGTILDLHQADSELRMDMLALIRSHKKWMPRIQDHAQDRNPSFLIHPQNTTLMSPVPRPVSMRDAYAFRQHVETARRNRGLEMIPEFDLFPVTYFTNHQAVTGPGIVDVQSHHLTKLDYELEVAIVTGLPLRNATIDECDESIFGYMIMNDWSARYLQMEEMKLSLGPAKGKDFATSLGPWLVTKDELLLTKTPKGLVLNATMKAFVNGKELSSGNANTMNWTFAQILQRTSYGIDINPGEVIGSGTVGTGCLLELNGSKVTENLWLTAGDSVRLTIEGLGELTNEIHERPERFPSLPATLIEPFHD